MDLPGGRTANTGPVRLVRTLACCCRGSRSERAFSPYARLPETLLEGLAHTLLLSHAEI